MKAPPRGTARRAGRPLAWLALLALTACAATDPAPGTGWREVPADEIRIDILNNNFTDVTVRVVVRGARQERLGTVTGKTEASYSLPWDFSQPLRLELDLLAGPRCLTEALDVDPGDVLQLEIMAAFQETPWCARG